MVMYYQAQPQLSAQLKAELALFPLDPAIHPNKELGTAQPQLVFFFFFFICEGFQ